MLLGAITRAQYANAPIMCRRSLRSYTPNIKALLSQKSIQRQISGFLNNACTINRSLRLKVILSLLFILQQQRLVRRVLQLLLQISQQEFLKLVQSLTFLRAMRLSLRAARTQIFSFFMFSTDRQSNVAFITYLEVRNILCAVLAFLLRGLKNIY